MSDQSNPSPDQIRATREAARLTPAEAAAMVHALERSWYHWESGAHRMPAASWELFLIKLGAREARA